LDSFTSVENDVRRSAFAALDADDAVAAGGDFEAAAGETQTVDVSYAPAGG
jgi:hypothetical protein